MPEILLAFCAAHTNADDKMMIVNIVFFISVNYYWCINTGREPTGVRCESQVCVRLSPHNE